MGSFLSTIEKEMDTEYDTRSLGYGKLPLLGSRTQASTLKLTLLGPGPGRASYYSTLDKFAIIEEGSL